MEISINLISILSKTGISASRPTKETNKKIVIANHHFHEEKSESKIRISWPIYKYIKKLNYIRKNILIKNYCKFQNFVNSMWFKSWKTRPTKDLRIYQTRTASRQKFVQLLSKKHIQRKLQTLKINFNP